MKVIGIGNALMDILVQIPTDGFLDQLGLPKASMTMIDLDTHQRIFEMIQPLGYTVAAGGSAANTINGIARLGHQAGFIGQVANDLTGAQFEKDQRQSGIDSHLIKNDILPSGKCIALVSNCGERTMASFLGTAAELCATSIDDRVFEGYSVLYVEGYLAYSPELIIQIMERAKGLGLTIALDLASYNVVDDCRDTFCHVINNYVDIIFANEQEALHFTGLAARDAVLALAKTCSVAVVKIGARGSLIKTLESDQVIHVDAMEAAVCDKTGAGDLYAAGFLYGMNCGYSFERCGKLGTLLSSKVIEVMGPKLSDSTWEEIKYIASSI